MGWIVAPCAIFGAVAGFLQFRLMRASMREGAGRRMLLPLAAKLALWAATLALPLFFGIWALIAAALSAALVYTAFALVFMLRARKEG